MRTSTDIHGASSLTIKATNFFPPTSERRFPFYTTDVVVKDKDGNQHVMTLFHEQPLTVTVPEPEKPMDVMGALNDLCTIR